MKTLLHLFVQTQRAFTLVELLVVVVIISLLAGLSSVGAMKALKMASKAEEINGARNLVTGYLAAASDNGGRYLPGFDGSIGFYQSASGEVYHGPEAQRYPWRLADYMSESGMLEAVICGPNKDQVEPSNTYEVSNFPAFGINAYFVGGYVSEDAGTSGSNQVLYHSDCITHVARTKGSIIAFASSGIPVENDVMNGFNRVTPPNIDSGYWSAATAGDGSDPDRSKTGNVHARYNGKAIVAFLDGSVQEKTMEQLDDMRLWSYRAAETNNSDYVVSRSGSGAPTTGGGRLR